MIVSAIFLALAFRGLQPDMFWRSLAAVSLPWLLAATLVYFAAVVVIALRWQFLLRAEVRAPLSALVKLVFIGYMGNNVYPLRAGDALRIVLLSRNHGAPLVRVTTIVAIERMIDGCVMLSFVVFSLLLIDLRSGAVETIVSAAAPVFTLALALALLLAAKPALLGRFARRLSALLPLRLGAAITGFSDEIAAGLAGMRSAANLPGAIAASYLTWGIEAATYWLVMQAFGLELNFAVALLLVGSVNLAGLLPATPGQAGVNEFVVISVLTALGVAAPTATACAVVVHIVIWLPITVAGFALLLRQGMGWADISRASALSGAEDTSPEPG